VNPQRVAVLADTGEVARTAAAREAEAGQRAIAERGAFRIGLSGGRTPGRLYQLLAFGAGGTLDWGRVVILFADERAVPPSHRDSNYRLVYDTLIEPLRLPGSQVHRMRGDADELEAAAREYEPLLAEPIDLLLLGIGEDGHTASVFPHSPLFDSNSRVAAVLDAPKPPARRLTLTPKAIGEARELIVLATGPDKAAATATALREDGDVRECPARLARRAEWLLDADAGVYFSDRR
jgi:6-phosphogluconolactonase